MVEILLSPENKQRRGARIVGKRFVKSHKIDTKMSEKQETVAKVKRVKMSKPKETKKMTLGEQITHLMDQIEKKKTEIETVFNNEKYCVFKFIYFHQFRDFVLDENLAKELQGNFDELERMKLKGYIGYKMYCVKLWVFYMKQKKLI